MEDAKKEEKKLKKQMKKQRRREKRQARKAKPKSWAVQILLTVVFGLVWVVAWALTVLSIWYQATFDMEFAELLFTLMSPVGGTGQSTVSLIIASCVPPVIVLLLIYVAIAFALHFRTRLCNILRRVGAVVCLVGLAVSIVAAVIVFRIPRYIELRLGHTMIYDEYYVEPNSVNIYDTDGVKKNLIYIYLESMETTYASKDVGGSQSNVNYIPNLTQLAQENISFSDGEGLGGYHSITGTGWTMGALMSTTSGVPFSQEVFGKNSGNSQGANGNFANDMTALGDVLEAQGYKQEFLCGSDAAFAGRDAYFTQHGSYKIFDLYSARNAGYISKDYDDGWWGYEDYILFDIAKDEVTKLAQGDRPFNFTMLTVDTHHVGGHQCAVCPTEYNTNLENVIACTDRLLGDFIEWCEEQDWYEDTVIIISGDHPRMDKQLVSGTSFYNRTIYNCFIHSEGGTENLKKRTFTAMDMFPTILAALGYTIEGDRLGLGTNLFSELPTLAEELGYSYLETEFGKYSSFYKKHFT